jgi:hypothetical protein
MSKRTTDKVVSWRVIRLRGSPALWVGDVDAPDEPSESNEVVWEGGPSGRCFCPV